MNSQPYSRVSRTDYPDSTTVAHDTSDHHHDFGGHYLPQLQLHHLALHDWGIARGLEVSASGSTLTVQPGVAIDQQGQLIVLASGGYGNTGANPLAGQHNPVKTPVLLFTGNLGGDTVYVTIRFAELPQSVLPAPDTGPAERLEQAPWLRLRTCVELAGDEAAGIPFLVLAIADIDQNGRVVALRERAANDSVDQHRRRLLGETLSFRRPVVQDNQVMDVDVVMVEAGQDNTFAVRGPLNVTQRIMVDGVEVINSRREWKGEKAGLQGERGPQGERGLQGLQGIQGERGPQGERGLQGEFGPQGPQGAKGDRGDPGTSFWEDKPQYNQTEAKSGVLILVEQERQSAFYVGMDGERGRAGQFRVRNKQNNWTALSAINSGLGSAAEFFVDVARLENTAPALVAGRYNSVTGIAAQFLGDVEIRGRLTKSSGGFQIDHPLDPANKYLNHSFVESPDMKNMYDGVVTLDDNGEAWVDLPQWFEAINANLCYQLTALGAPAPGLYIAQKVQANRFKIAGGSPHMEVAWQVTGIRQDPVANANRIVPEEEKSAEVKGKYLYPRAYDQPETRGITYMHQREQRDSSKDSL